MLRAPEFLPCSNLRLSFLLGPAAIVEQVERPPTLWAGSTLLAKYMRHEQPPARLAPESLGAFGNRSTGRHG